MAGARVAFGDVEVLRGLELEVRRGEFVALVGPSGLRQDDAPQPRLGLAAPAGGHVDDGRERVRMVFQQDGLFPWRTVGENVRLGLRHVARRGGARAARGSAARPGRPLWPSKGTTRTSSRAGCASGWSWCARWPATPTCC